ncbi:MULTISPECIES: hypothetical protein [Corynebacterium]|uniref:hypothetical protein n=1 Tax=Corynebacterium TaxID=1716 RepID=UPI000619ED0E|nr:MULTISPECIES: hypothetical protein [Corynebacterium]MDU3197217.1 hypothetical protein [Corynebacterium kroppenstedtii]MCF6778661.1 hypothetical protein [Corynebacterium parakroppenstedtii]MCF6784619.1 hypothetical protein [Corynebacterium parakroppenstedtii]MCF6788340.1 hypothetical protein [Corynebacterium parakroppenstedtii]MCF6790509.1 hypothetical protein [Corynebacterium parakroppenstedtii]
MTNNNPTTGNNSESEQPEDSLRANPSSRSASSADDSSFSHSSDTSQSVSSERVVYNGTPPSRGRLPIYTFVGTGLVFACAIGVGVWKLSSPETASSTPKHPTTVDTESVSSNDKTNDVEAAGSQGSNDGGTSNSGQGKKNSGNAQNNSDTRSGNQSNNRTNSGDKSNRRSNENRSHESNSQGNNSQSHEESNSSAQWDEDPILPPGTKRGETHLGALGVPRDNGNTSMGQHSGTSNASDSTADSDNAPGIGLWFTNTPDSLQRVLSNSQLHQAREIIDKSAAQAQSEAVHMHRNKDGVWIADNKGDNPTEITKPANPSEPHSIHPSSSAKPTPASDDSHGSSHAPTPSEPSAQPSHEPTPTDNPNDTYSGGGAAQPTTTHPSAIQAPTNQGNQNAGQSNEDGVPTQERTATTTGTPDTQPRSAGNAASATREAPTPTVPHTSGANTPGPNSAGPNSAGDGSEE